MKNAAKEIIYGVCDKTNKNDSYFGFFKNLEDSNQEKKLGVTENP